MRQRGVIVWGTWTLFRLASLFLLATYTYTVKI